MCVQPHGVTIQCVRLNVLQFMHRCSSNQFNKLVDAISNLCCTASTVPGSQSHVVDICNHLIHTLNELYVNPRQSLRANMCKLSVVPEIYMSQETAHREHM